MPRQLAEVATPGRVAEIKRIEADRARHEARTAEQATDIAELLGKTVLRFEVKAGPTGSLFGSVTPTDVAEELWRTRKVRVDRRKIDMEPLKRIGRYSLAINVYEGVVAEVKTLVVPEGGELPPEEELQAMEAAEAAEAAAAAGVEEPVEDEPTLEEVLAAEDAVQTEETETDALVEDTEADDAPEVRPADEVETEVQAAADEPQAADEQQPDDPPPETPRGRERPRDRAGRRSDSFHTALHRGAESRRNFPLAADDSGLKTCARLGTACPPLGI